MNVIRLAAQIFLIYLLYKLVVNVIIPIFRSTTQIKAQFKEMQDKMDKAAQENQASGKATNYTSQAKTSAAKGEDYIEFEEIK